MKQIFLVIAFLAVLVAVVVAFVVLRQENDSDRFVSIANFEECASAGYPIMESYPRQCRTPDDQTFVEDIGNELGKIDLIRVSNPRPNQIILSPLLVEGDARGPWFFEASFPVRLFDGNGKEIAIAIAQAKREWMTEEFVPFGARLEFAKPATGEGTIIFEKDNPSGLSEHDDSLIMPIRFE